MASKAANVSLHSVRNGEVPAEDAAQGLEKNFLFEHWKKIKKNLREMFKSFGGNLFGNISISVFCFWRKLTWKLSKQLHVGQKWASQPQICLLSLNLIKRKIWTEIWICCQLLRRSKWWETWNHTCFSVSKHCGVLVVAAPVWIIRSPGMDLGNKDCSTLCKEGWMNGSRASFSCPPWTETLISWMVCCFLPQCFLTGDLPAAPSVWTPLLMCLKMAVKYLKI